MSCFSISLACTSIGVSSLFPQTKDFCKDYLTKDAPLFNVEITKEDIQKEREINEEQIRLLGLSQVDFSDEYIETLALYRKVTERLVDFGVLLVHGAVMAVDDKAYLFTAKSGTGKTTHCNLWLKNIKGSYVLNGDKPLLLFKEDKVFACGTPWMGKENLGVNKILPLEGFCILERNKENHIEKIPFSSALEIVLNQVHRPAGREAFPKVVKLLKNLEKTNFYRLGCNMEDEAAFVSYNAMASAKN